MSSTQLETLNPSIMAINADGLRFADTATEILRRTQVGPKGPLSTLDRVWPDGREYLLTHLTTEVLSPEGLKLLGFESPEPAELKSAIDQYVGNAHQRLLQTKSGGKPEEIAQIEREIAHEVRQIVSGITYEKSVDYPAAMANKRALNCVGAQYLGCHLLDQIGLSYLMAEVPGHSVHMLVTTADNRVYFQDMLSPETNVEMTDSKMVDGQVSDLTDLVVSDVHDGVITFTLNTPELDGMRAQLLPRQGQQFVCRAYSGEIGYSLQLLHNLSLKFHKPEWVMSFSKIGLSISSEYAPLKVRLGNATEILEGLEQAKIHYEAALAQEPNVANNHRRMGRVYQDFGDYQRAIEYYDAAIGITPNDGSLWTVKGRVYERLGDTDRALESYAKAMEIDPKLITPRIDLIKIHLVRGDEQQARQLAEDALHQTPYNDRACLQLAEYFETQYSDLAEQAYKKAIDQNGSGQTFLAFADYLSRSGRLDEAIQNFELAVDKEPSHIYYFLKFARTLKDAGRVEESTSVLRRSLNAPYKGHQTVIADDMLDIFEDMEEFPEIFQVVVFPINDHMYGGIADLLAEQGDYEHAAKACQNAVDINPFSKWNYNKLAETLSKLNRTDEAILAYQKALAIDPSYTRFADKLGQLLVSQGRVDEAVEMLSRSAKNVRGEGLSNHHAVADVARQLVTLGQVDQAKLAYEIAIETNHNNAASALICGNEVQKLGDTALSERAYRRALEIKPGYARVTLELARLLNQHGRNDEASGLLQQFIEIDNQTLTEILGSDGALQDIAKLGIQLGNTDLAKRAYSMAIDSTGNFAKATICGNELRTIDQALAERAYRRALELNPRYARAAINLSEQLMEQGKSDEAKEVIQSLISQPELVTDPLTNNSLNKLKAQFQI